MNITFIVGDGIDTREEKHDAILTYCKCIFGQCTVPPKWTKSGAENFRDDWNEMKRSDWFRQLLATP